MKSLPALPLFVVAALLAGCTVETWEIDPVRYPCYGLEAALCLGWTDASGERGGTEGGISGFDFQWGVRATVRVEVTEILNPPADGSSRSYELLEVVSTTPVADDETVQLSLGPDHLSAAGPGQFSLLGVAVGVPDPAIEQGILDALELGALFPILFEYGEGQSLVAVELP